MHTYRILITGLGKSGLTASRLSSSLSSLGVIAEYVHATEWFHGDLGKITKNDVVSCVCMYVCYVHIFVCLRVCMYVSIHNIYDCILVYIGGCCI